MYRSLAIAAATVTACTLIVYAVGTSADTCPAGTVPITDAMRADATAAGIPASAQCWNPNDANVGQNTGQAKQDLQNMWCGNSNAQCTYNGTTYTSTIEGLDPKFVQCADKFMQALRQQSPGVCINSAYRSTAQQMCACARTCPNGNPNGCSGLCAPPGHSYHQRGLAIDVGHVSIQKPQFWSLALQFGIGNPTGLHSSDPYHIQAMNGGTNCASLGYQPTDADVFTPGPASTNPYFNYGPNPLPSMSPFSQTFPQLTYPAQPQTPAQTTPTVTPQQCAPQFSCVNNTIYFQTTACTSQVYQTCPYGCAGTVCLPNPASTTSPILGTTYPVIVPSTTPATVLQQFANPVLTAATSARPTATPTLTSGIYNVISAEATSTQSATSTGGSVSETLPAQQTFVSSDLSGSGYTPAPSGLISILQNLQTALAHLFSYLVSIGH